MPRLHALAAAVLLAAGLNACSGYTHLHGPKPVGHRGATATVNALMPVDFSIRAGFGSGWDGGLRFSLKRWGFSDVHLDVQRDLYPGRDGNTVSVGMGAGLSSSFSELIFDETGGQTLSLQPYVGFGDDREYGAVRAIYVRSLATGETRVLPSVTAGMVRGGDTGLIPEVSLVSRTPVLAFGIQRRWTDVW
jgi:hypothetical protein